MKNEDQILTRLIDACLRQESGAEKALYEHCADELFTYCLRYCHNSADAEDVFQEGFVHIFEKLGQFEAKGSFMGWCKKIMLNETIKLYGSKRHQLEFPTEEKKLTNIYYEEEDVIDKISTDELMEIIQQMPTGYRLVFNMSVIDGYDHETIAQKLDCTVSTSRSQLSKAKKYLQQTLCMIKKAESCTKIKMSN